MRDFLIIRHSAFGNASIQGASPVFFTSFSVVMVVVPLGVVIWVSCLIEDLSLSAQPMIPLEIANSGSESTMKVFMDLFLI